MKTFSRSILFVSLAALLALSSCSKDDDPEVSKTELLKYTVFGIEAEITYSH